MLSCEIFLFSFDVIVSAQIVLLSLEEEEEEAEVVNCIVFVKGLFPPSLQAVILMRDAPFSPIFVIGARA